MTEEQIWEVARRLERKCWEPGTCDPMVNRLKPDLKTVEEIRRHLLITETICEVLIEAAETSPV